MTCGEEKRFFDLFFPSPLAQSVTLHMIPVTIEILVTFYSMASHLASISSTQKFNKWIVTRCNAADSRYTNVY